MPNTVVFSYLINLLKETYMYFYLKFLNIRNKILVLRAKYKIRRKVWLCLVKYHLPCDKNACNIKHCYDIISYLIG